MITVYVICTNPETGACTAFDPKRPLETRVCAADEARAVYVCLMEHFKNAITIVDLGE